MFEVDGIEAGEVGWWGARSFGSEYGGRRSGGCRAGVEADHRRLDPRVLARDGAERRRRSLSRENACAPSFSAQTGDHAIGPPIVTRRACRRFVRCGYSVLMPNDDLKSPWRQHETGMLDLLAALDTRLVKEECQQVRAYV